MVRDRLAALARRPELIPGLLGIATFIILSIAILVASSLFFAWLAAKVYRTGVLLYGKRPSFREIVRLMRSA